MTLQTPPRAYELPECARALPTLACSADAFIKRFAVFARMFERPTRVNVTPIRSLPQGLSFPFGGILVPVSGLGLAVWLLGETVSSLQVAGLGLVIAGVVAVGCELWAEGARPPEQR